MVKGFRTRLERNLSTRLLKLAWSIFRIIWGRSAGSLDNSIKPWLISHGNDMPFILTFFGAFGGAQAFGSIGVLLGAALVAVGFHLVEEWNSSGGTSPGARSDTGSEALEPVSL